MHKVSRFALRAPVLMLAIGLTPVSVAFGQTVINIPPSNPITSAGTGVTVNVLPGGQLTSTFETLAGGTLNVNGGTTGIVISRSGSVVNLLNGTVHALSVDGGSSVTVSGGRVADQIYSSSAVQMSGGRVNNIYMYPISGSAAVLNGGAVENLGGATGATIELVGLDFAIDGVPVSGLANVGDTVQVNLPVGSNLSLSSVLTGTLADGRALSHDQWSGVIQDGVLTLRRSATPAAPTSGDIHVTTTSPLEWIGAGQNVFVEPGGQLPEHFRAGPGSRVQIDGGRVEDAMHAVGATVKINSGTLDNRFNAYEGTVVDLNGGTIHGHAMYFDGSTLNVHGGVVGGATLASGATANIYGGEIYNFSVGLGAVANVYDGDNLRIHSGGSMNVFGGNFTEVHASGPTLLAGGAFPDWMTMENATLTLEGTEFRRNGVLVGGLGSVGDMATLDNIQPWDVIHGVLRDGTSFVFSEQTFAKLPNSVKLVQSAPTTGPTAIFVPNDPAPLGIRGGQTLTLAAGRKLAQNFTAGWGSALNITGGEVGENFNAIGANIQMTGGVLTTANLFASALTISGPATWGTIDIFAGSSVTIDTTSGVGGTQKVYPGGRLRVSGGVAGPVESDGGQITITGGAFGGGTVTGGTTIEVGGGAVNEMTLFQGSKITATGGTIVGVSLRDGSSAIVDGAAVSALHVSLGTSAEIKTGNIGSISSTGSTKLRGGALGDYHGWYGVMEVYGDDFQIDGTPVGGLANPGDSVLLSYPAGSLFTGVLSDGTPLAMMNGDNDALVATGNSVRLIRTAPAAGPTTIDVPMQSAPRGARAGQTVIVRDGGTLDSNFVAGHDSVVDIRGGAVGANFEAERSQVLMSGGVMGERMDLFRGAVMTVTGGTISSQWALMPGGRLDLEAGTLQGQGRVLGGALNISGGSVDHSLEARDGAVVTVSGGVVGSEFKVFAGSQANISGGRVGSSFGIESGGAASITGGRLTSVDPRSGSVVTVDGGVIDAISPRSGSTTVVRNGAFGDAFENFTGASTTLHGVDFEINGAAVAGLDAEGAETTLTIAAGQLLTGTFQGGTPMAFLSNEGDHLRSIRLVRSALPSAGPSEITVSNAMAPLGVHMGQTLNVAPGGNVQAHFNAGRGSTVNVNGGVVSENLEAYHAIVNVNAGSVGAGMDAFAGSQIVVRGGTVGPNVDAYAQSTVSVLGGLVSGLDALAGSTINVGGGKVGQLTGSAGSRTDWSGGVIGAVRTSSASAMLWVQGLDFELNGVPVAGLTVPGNTLMFNLPVNSILTGVLADGTPLVLNSSNLSSQIANGSLRLVRATAPGPLTPTFQVVDGSESPFAIGAGQTLELRGGGKLPSGFIAGPASEVSMLGGSLGTGFTAFGADVAIRGGVVGSGFTALEGTDVEVFGGTLGSVSLHSGAHAKIFGGVIPRTGLLALAGSAIDLYGSSFKLNGQPIAGLDTLGDSVLVGQRGFNQVLSGMLADGTMFSLSLTLAIEDGRQPPFGGFSSSATLRLNRLDAIPEPTSGTLAAAITAALALQGRAFRRKAAPR